MQTTTINQNSRTTDPEWSLLGEYPLNELVVEVDNRDRTNARLLFQTIRDLGVPLECLNNIEKTLREYGKEAMARCNQGRSESPVYIRLFCQKTTIEDVNSAGSSRQFTAEQTSEPTQIIHHSDAETNGGWGYFLVERGGGFPVGLSASTGNWIDLYLYNEGE